jgi:hypothetical protein
MARSTFRSVSYDLDASVALARQVERSAEGVSSQDLALVLGYSGAKNGAFLTRLANARLFGLVGGSSSRVTLADRGARILSSSDAESGPARIEAFLAVPLFRAVVEYFGDRPVPELDELETVVRDEFGETPSKARASAAKLLVSARQSRMVRRYPDGTDRFTSEFARFTDFTDFDGFPGPTGLQLPAAPDRGGVGRWNASQAKASSKGAGEAGREMESTQASGGDEADHPGIWLDEPLESSEGPGRRRRRMAVTLALVVCLAVVAVPVSLALAGSGTKVPHQTVGKITKSADGKSSPAAIASVLSALSATTDSGSFDFSYVLNSQPGPSSSPPTTTPQVCTSVTPATGTIPSPGALSVDPLVGGPVPSVTSSNYAPLTSGSTPNSSSVTGETGIAVSAPNTPIATLVPSTGTSGLGVASIPPAGVQCFSSPQPTNVGVSGSGVINVNPRAMVTNAVVGGGLNVVIREDDTNYWENLGGTQASLAPGPNDQGTGSALSGFAGLVSSTLGTREGPVAMMSMASPSGYLDLYQSEVTAAEEVGPSTVNGVPVTVYQIPVTPAQEGQVAGSAEETKTVNAALASLAGEGYTGTTVKISIDGEGYIRQSQSIANFSDGGTVTMTAIFSNFGCAGTVLMPGQSGSGVPPANCTSPVPSTTTTTAPPTATSVPSTSTTTPSTSTTTPPTTSTTVPPTTSTTSPPPTTSTTGTVPSSTTTLGG